MEYATLATVQMLSQMGQIERNIASMRTWIKQAADQGASFVVFPEGSLNGYAMENPGDTALAADDERIRALEAFAADHDLAVGYGFAEHDLAEDRRYVTYVVAYGDERLTYRKAHLGGREKDFYTAGNSLPVARIRGISVGVQLCWEAHIADIASTLRAQGAELLLSPHAGGIAGARRIASWNRYLPARAFDNGMFVVACNALRYGINPTGDALEGHSSQDDDGGLAVYGPDGKLIDSYHGTDEHMIVVEIGGTLPRERESNSRRMVSSYYDQRRPELYI